MHRDLRPENVLLSSDSAAAVVKLTGFGRAATLAGRALPGQLPGWGDVSDSGRPRRQVPR